MKSRPLGVGLLVAGTIGLVGLSPALAAGSPASTDTHAAAARTSSTIVIHGYGFHSPKSVRHGTKVTVTNQDSVAHTVTSTSHRFDVKVPAHATRTFTAPSKAGTYRFYCRIHPDMRGSLKVT